ncbi:glycogen debranching N-terminal domain-containing protein [Desertimonas flava]|uniref:amylo-alpha-1,6-glucosidase n=1 Tax=Desertimonas flava TaxID=2064846 RepID=UPI000E34198F
MVNATPPTTPWTFEGPLATLWSIDESATLVEGQTFCLSGRNGDLSDAHAGGLFVFDTRILSQWVLTVEGATLEPLGVDRPDPFHAVFVTRTPPPAGQADSGLLVLRTRHVGNGMRESIVVRNVGMQSAAVRICLEAGTDFANLFEVKEGRVRSRPAFPDGDSPNLLCLRRDDPSSVHVTAVRFDQEATVEGPRITWDVRVAPRSEWRVCIEVTAMVNGTGPTLRFPCGHVDDVTGPVARLSRWRAAAPVVDSDWPQLDAAVRRGIDDLGSLRIFDASRRRPVIAAGAPWFMALFGRDSLLTAWMSLPIDRELAIGVAETLAAFQGHAVDPTTEEEPGRILHEVRLTEASDLSLHRGNAYYGSVDATPLFVMLVGELARWGCDHETIGSLLPHVDAALDWIDHYGDRDSDGYVEYRRATDDGLANQGWKDSWDAVRTADGRLADPPIALCEVQGYVYAAFRARAELAALGGDTAGAAHWTRRADRLRTRFNEDFWLPERGWYALGLDADHRPIDALTSNMGHCLWTGIVDPGHAAAVAEHLLSPAMFSGWGVRTLATTMDAYNPVSYHNGSVWPHDSAIAAAGLMRYGHVDSAHRLIEGLIDASAAHAGRLPELFSGLDRSEVGIPVRYPTSCNPQAWASAAPLLVLRSLLRFDPEVNHGRLWLAPTLPASMAELHARGIAVADHEVSIHVTGERVEIEGSTGLEIATRPRPS